MADRSFRDGPGTLENGVVELFTTITVGASGAVTAFTGTGKGIALVTKETAAGQYTIALEDRYSGLLHAHVLLEDTTDSDPTSVAVAARLQAQTVATATPTVVIQGFALDDGADANFASGAKLHVRITLKNSSV